MFHASDFHTPVLLKEVLTYLQPKPNQNFIDCTIGGGGHTQAILEETAPNGKVLGIDADPYAINHITKQFKEYISSGRLILAHDNFKNLASIVDNANFGPISGILLDLGVSSFQLNDRNDGFSFTDTGPLDMRFQSGEGGVTAYEIINTYPKQKLKEILKDYGEIKHAGAIAHKIVRAREKSPIINVPMLVRVLFPLPRRQSREGSALIPRPVIKLLAKVWQAVRIEVNQELENLKTVLPVMISRISVGGRIAVMSYHSLEDRIVKHTFKKYAVPREDGAVPIKIITKKPITPQYEEIKNNPRSRSAKLRVAEKICVS